MAGLAQYLACPSKAILTLCMPLTGMHVAALLLVIMATCTPDACAQTQAECEASHGSRTYLSAAEGAAREPPVLYTFPGSGNTWVRMLIEYASGVHTGSIYRDQKIQSVMPGEEFCSRAVSVVKVRIEM
jgi:hypothetical protein